MVGSKFHGLWRLYIVATKPQSAANIVETSSQPAATRVFQKWHSRLGHVNFRTLHQMSTQQCVEGLPTLSRTDSSLCARCAHGKHHRGAFLVHDERKRVSQPGLFFIATYQGLSK